MSEKNLADFYKRILQTTQSACDLEAYAFSGLPESFPLKAGQKLYRGKVRELVIGEQDICMIHSDRLSAFDRAIGLVPYKGVILAATSAFWFKKIDGIIPHHYIDSPHPRIIRAKRLQPLKVEVVVRGYLAGSMQRAYQTGVREFCGIKLPENLQPFDRLPNPIITPTTKAEVYEHDIDISADELVAQGIVDKAQWEKIQEYAFAVFDLGQKEFSKRGWTLVDTKYEFGIDTQGKIHIIDEIHTPDSSRLWKGQKIAGQNPEMFDKEIVRRYLQEQGFSGYGEVPPVPAALFIEMAQRYLHVAENLLEHAIKIDTGADAKSLEDYFLQN